MTDSPLPSTAPNNAQPAAVRLHHVSQLFGSFVALRDVSLDLAAGSSVMLLGSNGAGKSTLLKLLAGLANPAFGEVHVFGQRPQHGRGRIAYMSHSTMLYDDLTAAENLIYLLGLHEPGLSVSTRNGRVADALTEVSLDPGNPRRLAEYSQGMRQRASLARVLLTAPDLLLLDEPFSNLDVTSAQAMLQRLGRYLAAPGTDGLPRTLLLTTHQAELARPLARLTLRLEAGRLLPSESVTAAVTDPVTTRQGAAAAFPVAGPGPA